MPGEIRRGREAIQAATKAAKSRGGDFKPFIRRIFWTEDKQERYLLFLNPIEEVPQFQMVDFIETEQGFKELTVAKTDSYFEERTDKFAEVWDAPIRDTDVAIVVELEPIIEVVNNRKKPKGFEVMTTEFSRKVVDDDGEVTEETEDVIAPAIGFIAQAAANFFNPVEQYDASEAPIHETPVKITRLGTGSKTAYACTGYEGQELDLSALFEYIDGITYLGDELEPLMEQIAETEGELAQAHVVGEVLLNLKVTELLDEERYEELFEGVDESMDKFGKKKKDKKDRKPKRSVRPSQRRAAESDSEDSDSEPEADAKPKARKKAVTKASGPDDKLAELKAKAAAKAKK